jgi:site-specific recombinase XerC
MRPDAKRALSTDELRRMVTGIPSTPHGFRDRAMLLIGFCGGFRRSELAAIEITHVEDTDALTASGSRPRASLKVRFSGLSAIGR